MKDGIKRITAAAAVLLLAVYQPALSQDWPQWRGEGRDSRVAGFQPPAVWPAELTLEWSLDVGWGDATPALVSGKLYLFTRQDSSEVLQCIDAASGEVKWSYSYVAAPVTGPAARHPGPRGTPSVAGNSVVVIGATGIVSCVNRTSGELKWSYTALADMVPVYFSGSSPLIAGDLCYAGLGGRERSAFVALDMESGKEKWKIEGVAPSYASPLMATPMGTNMIVVQADTLLMGVAPAEGRILWEKQTPVTRRYYNSASPVADGGKIYYTGQGNGTAALRVESGYAGYTVKELWRNSEYGTNYNTPVVKGGYIYGLNERGYLFCLDATTGKTQWADTVRHRDFGSIIDAGDLLVALSGTSNMVIYKPDPVKYEEVALIRVSETPVYAHPVLSGSYIYIKDQEKLIKYSVK